MESFKNSTLFGMTCDGLDIISKNIMVPEKMKVGDWLCFGGMGSYTHGSKSNFNGMQTTNKTFKSQSLPHNLDVHVFMWKV